jgi:imidazolonepropionase-like amidohydrolase
MAANGLTPQQVVAATSSAAELMGWSDRLGTIEPGKVADVAPSQTRSTRTLKDRTSIPWRWRAVV